MKKLTVLIPVYNETDTITKVLEKVKAAVLPGWTKEVIVIDDGSTDGTKRKLTAWEDNVKIIYKKRNEGKGSAITEGLKHAKGDLILIQDADLEYSPDDYPVLLAPFKNEQVDVVYGSRFLGPHMTTMFVYEVGNKFVTLLTNILYNTNITDMETGYKVFRKRVISGMKIHAKGFDVEPEVTAKLLKAGYQIYEVPISYFGRKFSEGKKLTWRDGVVAAWVLLKYRFA